MTTTLPRSAASALALVVASVLTVAPACARQQDARAPREWAPNDPPRPRPPIVDPGRPLDADPAGRVPSDAIVLFGRGDLSRWTSNGEEAKWKVGDGWFEVVPGTGDLATRDSFGDVQLHLEWAAPSPPQGTGQDRGNSGVFFMGRYEVQILDSYMNETYADGQAASLYGQHPPLVNASRPPGEWQTYDIIFRRPRFDADGKRISPAIVTVFHNGVLVHDHAEMLGPTAHMARRPYEPHPDRLPLVLQDHGQPVRFRNIWIRDLERTQLQP